MIDCSVAGCDHNVKAKGLCDKHWKRQHNGKSLTDKSWYEKTLEERFWEKVDIRSDAECWLWQGGQRGNEGHMYGTFWNGAKNVTAHRFSYELKNGPIPKSDDPRDHGVCHRCDTPLCVNPRHLFIGDHATNMRDTAIRNRRRKTHCKRGHAFTEENTYVSKVGAWHCRACHKMRARQKPNKEL